jgi:hypothetical protein
MPATYEPIATNTLGSATSSVTFSSIPSTYTDLILVFGGSVSAFGNLRIQVNSDTGSNYSWTRLLGDGSTASSDRGSAQTFINIAILDTNTIGNSIVHLQNYSNTTTYKTVLTRGNSTGTYLGANVALWRSTSAINSITVLTSTGNINSSTVISLYGIKAA